MGETKAIEVYEYFETYLILTGGRRMAGPVNYSSAKRPQKVRTDFRNTHNRPRLENASFVAFSQKVGNS